MQQAGNENKREQSMRNNQRKRIIISFNYLDYFYFFLILQSINIKRLKCHNNIDKKTK